MSQSRAGTRLLIGGGRRIPPLLFVTSRPALADRIGARATRGVLDAVRAAGHLVHESLSGGHRSPGVVSREVRRVLVHHPGIGGVVLLGGYDVVPAQRVDCLPPRLRGRVAAGDDPDNFIVWSDDVYGDVDGDSLPELPVSRVPDGGMADLVCAAMQVPAIRAARSRRGVRNAARPFADRIFGSLPGHGRMLRSSPTRHNTSPRYSLRAAYVYLVLHGLPTNGRAFWGEDGHRHPMAVTAGNLARRTGQVVFSGCCYGALIVEEPASVASVAKTVTSRPPERSMALQFLLHGARAFVGSTGLHYSPVQPPYDYFGAPLHEAFWRACRRGVPPARALWEAKHRYALGLPHGQARNSVAEAIEFKTMRQFTCLGLGW